MEKTGFSTFCQKPANPGAMRSVARYRKRPQFSLHNLNKIRHSFVIFDTNYPEESENSDDVIVTSLETTFTLSRSLPPPEEIQQYV